MILRKSLLRIVIALALCLLGLGLYSAYDQSAPGRIYENTLSIADKAYSSIGRNDDDLQQNWDELVDTKPLIERLEAGEKGFDWSQWLDLDKTKLFDIGELDSKLYPYLSTLSFKEDPEMPYERNTSPQEQAMIGRLYCKRFLSSPSRVVSLKRPENGDENSNVLTSSNGLRVAPIRDFEVEHENQEMRHRQYGHTDPTKYSEVSQPLVPDLKASDLSEENLLFPRVNNTLFTWRVDDYLEKYDENKQDHAMTVYRAWSDVGYSGKHFHEVWIRDDPIGYGVHYDWRFFRGIASHNEHVASLHACARSWQQFAELMGISYWYAHGSLLGHLWNGMTMPWDSDYDIQMPIMELDRLARDFNHTLVVQDPKEGYRKYFIDVSPFYVQRIRGNGKNVIDARFIDVDTGVYIDITGLARTDSARRMVSCKNRHSYRVDEFDRLRRTQYEGYPALIPTNSDKMLAKEYKSYDKPSYHHWDFNYKLQLWEYKQSCKEYLNEHKGSHHVYCFPSDVHKDNECMEKYGTCDRVTIKDYELTKKATEEHVRENELYQEISPISSETKWEDHKDTLKSLVENIGEYQKPFHNSTELEFSG